MPGLVEALCYVGICHIGAMSGMAFLQAIRGG